MILLAAIAFIGFGLCMTFADGLVGKWPVPTVGAVVLGFPVLGLIGQQQVGLAVAIGILGLVAFFVGVSLRRAGQS